jgi:RNA polymerase sigma-70 factor (ECF subfamily)
MAGASGAEGYADFIRRIREGDERAAEELVRLYEPEIRLEIRTRMRLRDQRLRRLFDSMDVCQSVLASFFVRAAVGEFDLDDPGRLVGLLVGMARNKLAERVRHHHRQSRDVRRTDGTAVTDRSEPAVDESPSQAVAGRELLAMFRDRLSPEERRVAELRSKGLDWAAVAGELGGTPEARRKQFARAVARVGQELGIDMVAGGKV